MRNQKVSTLQLLTKVTTLGLCVCRRLRRCGGSVVQWFSGFNCAGALESIARHGRAVLFHFARDVSSRVKTSQHTFYLESGATKLFPPIPLFILPLYPQFFQNPLYPLSPFLSHLVQ